MGFSCALNADGWYLYNNRSGQFLLGSLDYPTASDYVEEMNLQVQERVVKTYA